MKHKIKTEVFLIGNSNSNHTQEVTVKGSKVSTTNQKIRQLIKDFKKGKYTRSGEAIASVRSDNNYVIINWKQYGKLYG